jgi:putative ABC transport system ATP-binding protein
MSTTRHPILRTEHLTRVVDGQRLVDDISVIIYQGDVVAVVGPSGAGKSSFLRLLNRLDEPTEGTVYLDNQDYRLIPPQELRRRVGMVLQTPYLFAGTVADNVRFGPQQRGQEISDAVVEDLLARVGLAGYGSRPATNLSGGEAQRVSLARTLANGPEVLLLDEPTSALDDDTESEVEKLIVQVIQQQALTCVMITHDMAQAARMASRLIELRQGKLVRVGPIQEVLDAQPVL